MTKHFGGSFGIHKHGVSGRPAKSGRDKLALNRTVQTLRGKRKPTKMHDSVQALMRERRDGR